MCLLTFEVVISQIERFLKVFALSALFAWNQSEIIVEDGAK